MARILDDLPPQSRARELARACAAMDTDSVVGLRYRAVYRPETFPAGVPEATSPFLCWNF